MISVVVSSTCVYYFSEYLNFDEYFEKKHAQSLAKLRGALVRNEFLIVMGWSAMPFLPTDLICYVCGALEVDIKKFLLAVLIGEGITCAVYIFLGEELFRLLKILGGF